MHMYEDKWHLAIGGLAVAGVICWGLNSFADTKFVKERQALESSFQAMPIDEQFKAIKAGLVTMACQDDPGKIAKEILPANVDEYRQLRQKPGCWPLVTQPK